MTPYHQAWNKSTASSIIDAYPESDFKYEGARLIDMATDLIFRCGTRRAAVALSDAGHDTYLYQFDYRKPKYRDPNSWQCQLEVDIDCGVHHGAEVHELHFAGTLP